MTTAQFIIKQREFAGMSAPNPYRPRGQKTFGKWQVRGTYETVFLAHSVMLQEPISGLAERAVFYRGRRVTDTAQRINLYLVSRLRGDAA
jgi:hypothetical protein